MILETYNNGPQVNSIGVTRSLNIETGKQDVVAIVCGHIIAEMRGMDDETAKKCFRSSVAQLVREKTASQYH